MNHRFARSAENIAIISESVSEDQNVLLHRGIKTEEITGLTRPHGKNGLLKLLSNNIAIN